MPHFGLIDEKALGPVEGPLMRARLHMRGAKRRLSRGKISMGIITLYDALISAMQHYFASERGKSLKKKKEDDLRDDRTLYRILTESGVLDGSFDYGEFDILVGHALQEELSSYDYHPLLSDIDVIMTRLGVMPFDEDRLPPEDPNAE
jgi:aminopeptidase-like protein